MESKLIALDVDGTLLNSDHTIDSEVKESIRQMINKKKQVVLCSGSSCEKLRRIQEELGLMNKDNYVITNNGIIIQNAPNATIIKQNMIAYEDFFRLSEALDDLDLHYHLRTDEGILTPNQDVDKYTSYDSLLSGDSVTIMDKKEVANKNIYKLVIAGEPEFLAEHFPKVPKELLVPFSCDEHQFCFKELSNKEANKGAALAYLCHYLAIQSDEVMAIGDGYNDISMFQFAGTSVAMGNASRRVQAQARFITDTNDHQGVAKALYSWA